MRFLAVGVFNTVVGLGTIFVAQVILGLGPVIANAAGYVTGVTVSFLLNKRWTFRFRGESGASLARFITVFIAAYAANLTLVSCLDELAGRVAAWHQIFGILPYTVLFYLGCRWYVFPSKEPS